MKGKKFSTVLIALIVAPTIGFVMAIGSTAYYSDKYQTEVTKTQVFHPGDKYDVVLKSGTVYHCTMQDTYPKCEIQQ